MKIGLLQFELRIPGAASLKDKRRVVKSLKDRLHREHLVSVAEVAGNDVWNTAIMAVVFVSADGAYVHSVLDTIVRKLGAIPDALLVSHTIDVVDAQDFSATQSDSDPLWTPEERRDPD